VPAEQSRLAVCVYVGEKSQRNLGVGLAERVWGFRTQPQDGESIGPGDYLVLATGLSDGGPRVAPEVWSQRSITRLVVATLESGVYRDESTFIWPDERLEGQVIYPYRIKLDNVTEYEGVPLSSDGPLSNEIAEALRLSGIDRSIGRIAAAVGSIFDRETTSAPRVWWVNQGGTHAHERAGGYLWAPAKNKAGHALEHHTNVMRLRPGDVVVHYANGEIYALGRVAGQPEHRRRPAEYTGDA
jgi:hypothetical protein